MGIITSSSAVPASVTLGSQTATQLGACTPAVSSMVNCAFYIASETGGQTSVTCNTCGTINYIASGEWSGVSASHAVDYLTECASAVTTVCQMNAAATIVGLQYSPGYSSEGVMWGFTCSSSSSTPTSSGVTNLVTAVPGGNPIAWGNTSGTTLAQVTPTSGCQVTNGVAFGFVGSGATQQLTSNVNYVDYTPVETSGSATLTAHIANVGDLFIAVPWGIPSFALGTLTLGSQTFTCPASAQGASSSLTGMTYVCYLITTSSGAQTLTFTPSGSPTQFQINYADISLSGNNSFSLDQAAFAQCQASCTEGTTVTTPTVTPTATGSLVLNMVNAYRHTAGIGGSWQCYAYLGASEDGACWTGGTINLLDWIINSAAGSVSPNTTLTASDDEFESIVLVGKYTSTLAPAVGLMPPAVY